MNDPGQIQEHKVENRTGRRGPNLFVWVGLLVVFAGAVTYFVFFAYFPALRDFPWVNLPLVALGFLISARSLRRTLVGVTYGLLARVFASVAFFLSFVSTSCICHRSGG
jgi:uncharacterized membrane protein YesL